MTGQTISSDFAGANNSNHGGVDAFVAKVTSGGSLAWATNLGGSGSDGGYGIAVDGAGNALVTGFTNSSEFAGINNSFHGGSYDAFVAKVSSGGVLAWATYLGGSGEDLGYGIAVDGAGNALVTGYTNSSDFAGANNSFHGGPEDAFVAKVIGGGVLAWATYLGGSSDEIGYGIAVDGAGNALVTGFTDSSDFAGASNSYHGGNDAFVAKVISGGSLAWATYLGGSDEDYGYGVAVDGGGNALVTGYTYSSDFAGANNSYHGTYDAFVAKISLADTSTAPTGVDLLAASDTGLSSSDDLTSLDNSTSGKTLQFAVSGTISGATVTLYADGKAIGSATASGTTTTVTTDGLHDLPDGSRSITARQTEPGKMESPDSAALTITVDTAAPSASSVTPNLATVTDANVGSAAFSVTLVYAEAMNTLVAPTLTFSPSVSTTLGPNAGASGWSSNTTYVATYDVADANVTVPNVGIGVTLGEDAAGNVQTPYNGTNNFNIDTQNPTVTSVTASPTMITDATVAAAQPAFSVTVQYSEAMKTTVAPALAFSTSVSSTLTFNAAASGWTDNTHYVAKYNVADANVTAFNVGVQVTLGQDAAGNVQVPYNGTSNFSIDTQNPTVTSVTASPAMITDANVGTATFSVTVVYSEPMNTTVPPTLTFTPGVASTLTFASGNWPDNTHYVATYNVADANVTVPNIGIGVTLAQDLAGNVQVAYSGTNNFSIDTQDPTVTRVLPSLTTVTDANIGLAQWPPTAAGLFVRVTFSEPVSDHLPYPTLTFTPVVSGTLHRSFGFWINNTTYLDAYDVLGPTVPYVPGVGIGVTGGRDLAGNIQVPYQGTDDFDLNPTPTTVVSAVPFVTKITDTNVGNAGDPSNPNHGFAVRITYSGPMNTSTTPTVTFAPDVSSTLHSNASQSWWINAYTYKAAYDVSDANAVVSAVGIRAAGALDQASGRRPARYSGPDVFLINTTTALALANNVAVMPTLTVVSDLNVTGAGGVPDTFQFRLTYDKPMNTDTTPVITFAPSVADTLTFDPTKSWWVSDKVYKAVYTVTDANVIHSNIAVSTSADGIWGRGRGTWWATTSRPPRSTTCSTSTR